MQLPKYKLIDWVFSNQDKIDWNRLSENPNAIELLSKFKDKINWRMLSRNKSIFALDYKLMRRVMLEFYGELVEVALSPRRIRRIFELTGCSPDDLDKYM